MIEAVMFGLIAMLFWGFSDFFSAIVAKHIDCYKNLFWSQLIGIAIMLLYPIFLGFAIPSPKSVLFIIIAALANVVALIFFYTGLSKGMVSIISPISSGWPIVTVMLSLIFFKETLQMYQIIGILLVIFGTIIISIKKLKKNKITKGAEYGLVAMICWGISLFVISQLSQELGWYFPVFYSKITALILISVYVIITGRKLLFKEKQSITPLMLSGILMSIAFVSYGYGVTKGYTSIVAPVSAAYTGITVILARIFLKEKLKKTQFVGIAMILVALIILSL
ncbi:MAG: hypothetical protein MAG795_00039 [Candidatus Woesearchaeota archaeon]|nr:hypothetical protein [Candidatus Woesearchaeota archaeon]